MKAKRLLLRADADPRIGTGHVMRCLALAQAARALGWDALLAGQITVTWVRERLRNEDVRFLELPPEQDRLRAISFLLQLLEAERPDWVVLDGYHLDDTYQQAVISAGGRLLVIDDHAHLPAYHCHVLLNQNIGAEDIVYRGNIGLHCLGPRYALLRREFRIARERAAINRTEGAILQLLISLGGGNFSSWLRLIAAALPESNRNVCQVKVIAGDMSLVDIRAMIGGGKVSIKILEHVEDMSATLLQADCAVSAGGSTCWELCCLGIPFVALKIAENQHRIVEFLDTHGIAPRFNAKNLERLLFLPVLRQTLSLRGMELVDGQGAQRVMLVLDTFESQP